MHKSVLLHEAIDGLRLSDGAVFVDCTLGSGGHAEEVCRRFDGKVKVLAIDADADAIARSQGRLAESGCHAEFVLGNFRDLEKHLSSAGVSEADAFLFDLGWSTNQMEESGRGFSFEKDEPLYMTFDAEPSEGDVTAASIVNSTSEEELANLIYEFGEERSSRKIAKAIVEARRIKPIISTKELVDVITNAFGGKRGKIHPATKTFQALRIATNDELGAIKKGLEEAWNHLKSGGRIAVISFHSLEDRIVKNFIKEKEAAGEGKSVAKKPIVPTREEITGNRRSRSAKLRIIEKTQIQ